MGRGYESQGRCVLLEGRNRGGVILGGGAPDWY